MGILSSPWAKDFEVFVASARGQLRIAAPYYSEGTIRTILNGTRKGVVKQFLLALSDRDVKFGAQSVGAIDCIHEDGLAAAKFIKNLHAKLLIADQDRAILTSSNLTANALDRNVELGILISDRMLVRELVAIFDMLWAKAGPVEEETLNNLRTLGRGSRSPPTGKIYGTRIILAKHFRPRNANANEKVGWILMHTPGGFGADEDYDNPMDELKDRYEPGLSWHWKRGKPLNEGGPYTLLFAWGGEIFGEATAIVTRKIQRRFRNRFNMAFVLTNYKERRRVPLNALPLTQTQRDHHRDLIKLNHKILRKYGSMKIEYGSQ